MSTDPRHRGRWAAVGLGLGLTGCAPPAPPAPSAPSAFEPCLDSTDRLIADVDDDGHRDRITGTEGAGADLGIAVGTSMSWSSPAAGARSERRSYQRVTCPVAGPAGVRP